MDPKDYNINPTNMTDVINKKGVSNRDNNILMYILIVVGASILLLLIPLIRYIAQWSKRKMRRRRRRKQIEKAYARRMAERDILEKIVHENRKKSTDGLINKALEISPPLTPISHSPRSSCSVESQPCSPTWIQKPAIVEVKPVIQCDLNGYTNENGLINKGYQSNRTAFPLPLRKTTSDMYLPRDPTFMNTAKRRFSENTIEKRENPSVNDVHRKLSLMSEVTIEKRKVSGLKEKEIQKIVEENEQNEEEKMSEKSNEKLYESNDRKVSNSIERRPNSSSGLGNETFIKPESNPDIKKDSLDSGCHEIGQTYNNGAFDSDDDYDDICDEISKNVNRKDSEKDDDGPIYDVVESPYSSGSEHIYSNVDELSDTESHIYNNVDSLHGDTMKSNDVESDVESEGEDYVNLDFLQRSCDSGSDTSSVSYENLDFLDGNENEAEEDKQLEDKQQKPPLIIPRRIPIPDYTSTTGKATTNR